MIKNILYALKRLIEISPFGVFFSILKYTLGSCRWAIYNVVFLRILINMISEGAEISAVINFLLIFASIFIAMILFFSYFDYVLYPHTELLYDRVIHSMIMRKAGNLDIAYYESPDNYSKIYNVMTKGRESFRNVLDVSSSFIANIASLIILLLTTLIIDRWAILFAIVPVITTMLIGNTLKNLKYNFELRNLDINRKLDYVRRVSSEKKYSGEIRTTSIVNVIKKLFVDSINEKNENINRDKNKISILDFFNEFSNQIVMTFGIIGYFLYRTLVVQSIQIGEFVVISNTIILIYPAIIRIFNQVIRMSEESQYINLFREFMEYDPVIKDGNKELKANKLDLSLYNVSFAYVPGKKVLHGINLKIKHGEKIAIVGKNGSGKTTLIKLLMRLYDPNDGYIKCNNIDIREYKVDEYRKQFSIIFQDFNVYSFSIAENIKMADNTSDNGEVVNALEFAGLKDAFKECSLDTNLSKEFDKNGIVLSGGQKQKLAIARAKYHSNHIFILDEPTSALDPIAESEMYGKISSLTENKTVIYVTHQMSSCLLADRILFMKEGEITEEGTHEQLMVQQGDYFNIFSKQLKGYDE